MRAAFRMQARLQRQRLELEPHSNSLNARPDALNGDQISRAKSSEVQKAFEQTPAQEEGEIFLFISTKDSSEAATTPEGSCAFLFL